MENDNTADDRQLAIGTPVALADLQQDQGLGLTDLGNDDQATPFLKILQAISREVSRKSDAYIQGAEPGMIADSVERVAFDGDEGIDVVCVRVEPAWIEWEQDDRGGQGTFVARHPADLDVSHLGKNDRGEVITQTGNVLVKTLYFYVLRVLEDGGVAPAVISMARSQLKKGRAWNRQMLSATVENEGQRFRAPSFYYKYRLRTTSESGRGGEYYAWSVERGGAVDAALYQVAKSAYETMV